MKKQILYPVRILLCILIALNLLLIFQMSSQPGATSNQVSECVTYHIADIVISDFDQKTHEEQQKIVTEMHPTVRKLAHIGEFGSLGALILALLLTWNGSPLRRYFASLAATLICAITDEIHQYFTANRATQWLDIGLDMLGAFLACSALLLLYYTIQKRKGRITMQIKTTRYQIPASGRKLRLAVASDLHGMAHDETLKILKQEAPDLILIPGDLTDDEGLRGSDENAYEFLEAAAQIAPTYYSLGNHELACYHRGNPWRHPTPIPLSKEIKERIAKTGAVLLDNECASVGDITLCGLTSGINGKVNAPNAEILKQFSKQSGYRILLCHHPEYFMPHIKPTNIELTVCGHAHGGQWRLFGQGAYAPGQGIFPKYTAGVLENRCVISRGLGNHTWIPRIFNTPEVVMIDLE